MEPELNAPNSILQRFVFLFYPYSDPDPNCHVIHLQKYKNKLRFAPPIPVDERFLERARNELTEEDKKGKTPEQIEDLVREMAIYIKQVELEKLEVKRMQEQGLIITVAKNKDIFLNIF